MSKTLQIKARKLRMKYAAIAVFYATIAVTSCTYGIYKAIPDKVKNSKSMDEIYAELNSMEGEVIDLTENNSEENISNAVQFDEVNEIKETQQEKTIESINNASGTDVTLYGFDKIDYFSGLIDFWGIEESKPNKQNNSNNGSNNSNQPTDTILDDLSPIELFFYFSDLANNLAKKYPNELYIKSNELGKDKDGVINPNLYENKIEELGLSLERNYSTLTNQKYFKNHSTDFLSDANQLSKISVSDKYEKILDKINSNELSKDIYAEYDSNTNVITLVTITDKYYEQGFNLSWLLGLNMEIDSKIYNQGDYSFDVEQVVDIDDTKNGLTIKYNPGYNGKVEIIIDGTPIVFYDLNYPILPIDIKDKMDEVLSQAKQDIVEEPVVEDTLEELPTEENSSLDDFWGESDVITSEDNYYNDYSEGLKDEISGVIEELNKLKDKNNKYKPIWGLSEKDTESMKDNITDGFEYIDKNFHDKMVLNVIDINGKVVDLEDATSKQKPAEILKPQPLENPGYSKEEFPLISVISLAISIITSAVFFNYVKQYKEQYTRELEFKLLSTNVENVEINTMEEITLDEMKSNLTDSDDTEIILFDS